MKKESNTTKSTKSPSNKKINKTFFQKNKKYIFSATTLIIIFIITYIYFRKRKILVNSKSFNKYFIESNRSYYKLKNGNDLKLFTFIDDSENDEYDKIEDVIIYDNNRIKYTDYNQLSNSEKENCTHVFYELEKENQKYIIDDKLITFYIVGEYLNYENQIMMNKL